MKRGLEKHERGLRSTAPVCQCDGLRDRLHASRPHVHPMHLQISRSRDPGGGRSDRDVHGMRVRRHPETVVVSRTHTRESAAEACGPQNPIRRSWKCVPTFAHSYQLPRSHRSRDHDGAEPTTAQLRQPDDSTCASDDHLQRRHPTSIGPGQDLVCDDGRSVDNSAVQKGAESPMSFRGRGSTMTA